MIGSMDNSSQSNSFVLNRLRLFLALSRTPHGLLDLATPALSVLLWLGAFPSISVTALGLVTAFAGYTTVYALNDVVDFPKDREKIRQGGPQDSESYLDAVLVRHPMALGLLSFREGIFWTAAWGTLALTGAYLLNPVCAVIFVMGGALEAMYCLLLDVSRFRALVSGMVKTTGGMAAVFAVSSNPSVFFLIVLFLWLFFWEIGGQNIPADWYDLEKDKQVDAKTIPVQFGLQGASFIVLITLTISLVLGAILLTVAPIRTSSPFVIISLAAGFYLLFVPALRLYRTKARPQASALFNRASYYPLTMFIIITINIMAK